MGTSGVLGRWRCSHVSRRKRRLRRVEAGTDSSARTAGSASSRQPDHDDEESDNKDQATQQPPAGTQVAVLRPVSTGSSGPLLGDEVNRHLSGVTPQSHDTLAQYAV